jgi:hypothetical protein
MFHSSMRAVAVLAVVVAASGAECAAMCSVGPCSPFTQAHLMQDHLTQEHRADGSSAPEHAACHHHDNNGARQHGETNHAPLHHQEGCPSHEPSLASVGLNSPAFWSDHLFSPAAAAKFETDRTSDQFTSSGIESGQGSPHWADPLAIFVLRV